LLEPTTDWSPVGLRLALICDRFALTTNCSEKPSARSIRCVIYFLPLRSSKLSRIETPVPDDDVTSLAVSIFACFNTNVTVVLELL